VVAVVDVVTEDELLGILVPILLVAVTVNVYVTLGDNPVI
jgi:hypothetical protein